MGMIQSSLNQLSLSALSLAAAGAKGLDSLKKPALPKAVEQPKVETTSNMGNIAKIGRDYSRKGFRSYLAAAHAVDSGNDMIRQKASTKFLTPEERIAQIQAASSMSFTAPKTQEKKGGKK